MEHKINCATNSIGQIDEAAEMGCTCGAEKKNNDSNSATVASYPAPNNVYHENCLETMDKMPANYIDLIVTSPPYFNNAKKYQRGKGIHYVQDVGEPLYSIEDSFEAATRILKDDGFYCINLGFSYGETGILRPFYVIERALLHGLFAVDVIIWKKKNPIPIQKRLTNAFEYIFVLAKHPHSEYPSSERIGYQHNFIETSVAAVKGHNAVKWLAK